MAPTPTEKVPAPLDLPPPPPAPDEPSTCLATLRSASKRSLRRDTHVPPPPAPTYSPQDPTLTTTSPPPAGMHSTGPPTAGTRPSCPLLLSCMHDAGSDGFVPTTSTRGLGQEPTMIATGLPPAGTLTTGLPSAGARSLSPSLLSHTTDAGGDAVYLPQCKASRTSSTSHILLSSLAQTPPLLRLLVA